MLPKRHQEAIKKLTNGLLGDPQYRRAVGQALNNLVYQYERKGDEEFEVAFGKGDMGSTLYEEFMYLGDLLFNSAEQGAYEGHLVVCIKSIELKGDKYEPGDYLVLGCYDNTSMCELYGYSNGDYDGGEYEVSWEVFNKHFVITIK